MDDTTLVEHDRVARDREHLLLPARERARALTTALAQLGEEVVHEVVARLVVALGEPQVLLHAEPGEDVAILRDVAHAAPHDGVRRQLPDVLAAELDPPAAWDEPHDPAERRRLPDAVPAEQRRDRALGDLERDSLQDVRLAEVAVDVVERENRRALRRDTHSGSPRYAP